MKPSNPSKELSLISMGTVPKGLSEVASRSARLSIDLRFKNPFFIHDIYSLLVNIMGINL
jgi:hypothetical protein